MIIIIVFIFYPQKALLKNPNRNRKRGARGLTFGHLKLCFVIVAFGCFSAFVSFCVENFMAWREHKKLKILGLVKNLERRRKRREVIRTCANCQHKMNLSRMSLVSNGTVCDISHSLNSLNPSVTVTDTDIEDHDHDNGHNHKDDHDPDHED